MHRFQNIYLQNKNKRACVSMHVKSEFSLFGSGKT